MPKEKIYVRRCESYDPEKIKGIVRDGMEELGVKPKGRMTIKPNLVWAHKVCAPIAFTPPDFVEGVLNALYEHPIKRPVDIVERCGITVPTNWVYKSAGYVPMAKRAGARLVRMEEEEKVRVPLLKGEVHDSITVARTLVDNDLLIYLPKLKSNHYSVITNALKLNIGILDDKERMYHHHFDLQRKVADLHEVGRPGLIITDAITVGSGGSAVTMKPLKMDAIIMATNAVAIDAFAAYILNLDPKEIDHIRITHERGWGPIELDDLEITGDYPFDELKERGKDFDSGAIRIDELDTSLDIRVGEPYCQGGCHGVLLETLYMLRDTDPKKLHSRKDVLVIGEYDGDVDSCHPVHLVGECTTVRGKLRAPKVTRWAGCPVTGAGAVIYFMMHLGLVSPYARPDVIKDMAVEKTLSFIRTTFRLKGRKRRSEYKHVSPLPLPDKG